MTISEQKSRGESADFRLRLGISPLINLTGTLTTMGGISARAEAREAAASIMGRGVDMLELQAAASRIIAKATGAEAGFVSACSAAGICMTVAGAMTGDNMAKIEQLPDTTGLPNEVVIQSGHMVNYGHPIVQDIRLTGARVVAIGAVNAATQAQLAGAIGPNTAAAVYVVSHHCAPDGQIPFADFARVCREKNVPVIVDLAAEYDMTGYHDDGADITIHSAHKFLGGATAGVVSGKKALVRAAFLQNYGMARPMKVGKESIAAALAALQAFKAEDRAKVNADLRKPMQLWRDTVAGLTGVSADFDADPTGNPFERLRITVAPNAGFAAVDLLHALETGTPSIRVRAHQLEHGSFVMDPRSLGTGEDTVVADRLRTAIQDLQGDKSIAGSNRVQAWKVQCAAAVRNWPDTQAEDAT